ncbi:hypothetical protein DHD05_18365 [Arenibacter sp. N53]|uniref:hypothetical protein n=1 Tax=Arenibacter TaxID=178469 RepID=UPI000CD47B24|nr:MULTISPECIES: hypothetical protein [Arenibacter]MCM4153563.1 hypothetical protein [Arenibacter sp. N53]
MKKYILGLFIFGFTSFIYSQNTLELAANNTSTLTSKKTTSLNRQYLENMAVKSVAASVTKLQKLAAKYDIKAQPIYSSNKSITYTVVFQDNENVIKAVYNYKGTIIRCEEFYTGIKLPYSISGKLAKDYPGWAFNNISYSIEYSQNKPNISVYQVELKKDKKIKSVRIVPTKA